MKRLMAIACAAAFACGNAVAQQSYPARPVRVIVPFAAGGTFDTVARTVSQKLSEMWSQQVIVDNRPGGGTIIATEVTAKSNPDGYTIFLSPNGLAANPALHRKLPYDAQRDLKAVVLIAAQPMALGANSTFRANNLKEMVEMAKAGPGRLSYGTAGIGSGGHLAGEIFKSMASIDVVHVSYKGGNVAMLDVMANQIPLVMTGLPNLLPHHKAGKIRILGITSAKRSAVAPDIPSIAETVSGYDFRNWFGFVVPAATPTPLVNKINSDVNKALASVDVRQRLVDQGFDVIGGTQGEFDALIRADTAKFARIIRAAGISVQ